MKKNRKQNQSIKIKREVKQTHQDLFTQFDPTMIYVRERERERERERFLYFTINEILRKRCKGLQQIYFNKALLEQI